MLTPYCEEVKPKEAQRDDAQAVVISAQDLIHYNIRWSSLGNTTIYFIWTLVV
jgi:hypothetical protein